MPTPTPELPHIRIGPLGEGGWLRVVCQVCGGYRDVYAPAGLPMTQLERTVLGFGQQHEHEEERDND